ncbi:hypothetical protein RUND412_009685 [Rhizina undulata]
MSEDSVHASNSTGKRVWPRAIWFLVYVQAFISAAVLVYMAMKGLSATNAFEGNYRWQLSVAIAAISIFMAVMNFVSRNIHPLEIIIADTVQAALWIATVIYTGISMSQEHAFGTCAAMAQNLQSDCLALRLSFSLAVVLNFLFIAKTAIAFYVRKHGVRTRVQEDSESATEGLY